MTTRAEKVTACLKTISPQFVVPDVVSAAEYYRNILGFQILGYFHEPPVYSIVRRDTVEIHLGKADAVSNAAPHARYRQDSTDVYIWVDDVDARFEELKSRGAKIVEPPTVRKCHCYEMVAEDKFGFRLAFGMNVPEQS
jgi:catechol 2,3-dioxygenase-like lactoylglutathione lyase family enzyme